MSLVKASGLYFIYKQANIAYRQSNILIKFISKEYLGILVLIDIYYYQI